MGCTERKRRVNRSRRLIPVQVELINHWKFKSVDRIDQYLMRIDRLTWLDRFRGSILYRCSDRKPGSECCCVLIIMNIHEKFKRGMKLPLYFRRRCSSSGGRLPKHDGMQAALSSYDGCSQLHCHRNAVCIMVVMQAALLLIEHVSPAAARLRTPFNNLSARTVWSAWLQYSPHTIVLTGRTRVTFTRRASSRVDAVIEHICSYGSNQRQRASRRSNQTSFDKNFNLTLRSALIRVDAGLCLTSHNFRACSSGVDARLYSHYAVRQRQRASTFAVWMRLYTAILPDTERWRNQA